MFVHDEELGVADVRGSRPPAPIQASTQTSAEKDAMSPGFAAHDSLAPGGQSRWGTARGKAEVMRLQRLAGNSAVVQLLRDDERGVPTTRALPDGRGKAPGRERPELGLRSLTGSSSNVRVDVPDPVTIAQAKNATPNEQEGGESETTELPPEREKSTRARTKGGPGATLVAQRNGEGAGGGDAAPALKPLSKASAGVKRLSTPGPMITSHIGGAWGMVDTERVDVSLSAKKEGNVWRAQPTKFLGVYSKMTRLIAGCTEVTGPGGNTTLENSEEQVRQLRGLGDEGADWYMVKAVKNHEGVHETRIAPSMKNAEPAMRAEFSGITVPVSKTVNSSSTAKTAIQALPAYAAAKSRLMGIWDPAFDNLIANDHAALTPAAERKAVNPMIAKINKFRVNKGEAKA